MIHAPARYPAALFLALAALAGCASSDPLRFDLDPNSYAIRGWYIGATRAVRLWVTDLRFASGDRGPVLRVDIVLVNERSTPIRFDLQGNRCRFDGSGEVGVEESVTHDIAAYETKPLTLVFPLLAPPDEIRSGTISIEGVECPAGEAACFSVRFERVPVAAP